LILSESVGIEENLAGISIGVTPTATPEIPTTVRFVNAISGGLPVEFLLNESIIETGLEYSQGSDLNMINSGDYLVEVRVIETGAIIGSINANFDVSSGYSVFAYGFGAESAQLIITPDSNLILSGNSPYLRLLNLTLGGDAQFGLAYSPTTASGATPSRLAESAGGETFRRSVPFGVTFIPIIDVRWGNFSEQALAPLGLHDLHIIDMVNTQIAASIRQVNLEPGKHYDVVAFQHIESQLVEGFVLLYP
jgi:hypothetical protein